MKHHADKHRREVTYQVGDQVLVSTGRLNLRGPGVRKLKPRWMGPFKVTQLVGPVAVKLALPEAWTRVFPVLHVDRLRPYHDSGLVTHRIPPPPLQFLDGEPVFEVEQILDGKVVKKGGGGVTLRGKGDGQAT